MTTDVICIPIVAKRRLDLLVYVLWFVVLVAQIFNRVKACWLGSAIGTANEQVASIITGFREICVYAHWAQNWIN